ncbi:Voltage-gated potassium channel subunit beta-1 [Liparis tanakae]|uniref:Voltage-gated potassium channel subunit beta-1 n=1 Tax=Liparis tanakae TaxID=230148 RepID=A0A4Z2HKD4_9TELE|nr:Voltage-gated potassium channel subunit beta-1 [Liparis tanakae]
MQVSLVCTDHRGGVSRTTEDRLNRQNANSPNTGTRSKFRAVAMVARSLGQLSVQSVPTSSEQSMRTGMKYRGERCQAVVHVWMEACAPLYDRSMVEYHEANDDPINR